jgi:uncharacterized protein YneF (UPF0154 family)
LTSRPAHHTLWSIFNQRAAAAAALEDVMANGGQVPAKKGIPTWAWVGIGCGALIIVVLIVMMAVGFFLARKVKDVAADFEKDPALAAARMIVKLNPELEEVAVDEDAGTITVRNTKTGEVITADFQDIKDGKIGFASGDKKITIDASQAGETGQLTVTDGSGAVVFSAGESSTTKLPLWVPIYPGTEPGSRHSMKTETTVSGGFEIETADPVSTVLEHYRAALDAAGYAVSVNTYTQDGSEGGMVNASHEGEKRTVVVILSVEGGGPTRAVVTYNQGG